MTQQQNLFETDPAPWEVDSQQRALTATVYLPTTPGGPFDYEVPGPLARDDAPDVLAEPGRRVLVPLGRGNRQVVGYCVAVETKPTTRKLKPLAGVIDKAPLLSPAMLRLTKWMSEYYLTPWGQVLESVLPSECVGKLVPARPNSSAYNASGSTRHHARRNRQTAQGARNARRFTQATCG